MLPLFVGSFALNFWLSDEMHFGGSWEVWKKISSLCECPSLF